MSLEIGLSLSMDPAIRTRLLNSGLPLVEHESESTVDVEYVVFNSIHELSMPVKEQFQVPDFQAGLIELQHLSMMQIVSNAHLSIWLVHPSRKSLMYTYPNGYLSVSQSLPLDSDW